jgi:hypothetical protein
VTLFLSGLPLWVMTLVLVVLPTLVSGWLLILVRHHVGLQRLTTNNEVAGFKFAVVGVIYAVLLAFAVIVVWGRYSDAEITVVREAGAATTLYRLAGGPEPEAVATRAALTRYLNVAIGKDWPQMSVGGESPEATTALDELYVAAVRLAQSGARTNPVSVAMFHQLDIITEARRSRLHLALGIVPVVLWWALVLGGVLTVAFTYFFGTVNLHAQVLMTCILAFIVFMGLYVIISIDHPFTGPVQVNSAALQRVLDDFARR